MGGRPQPLRWGHHLREPGPRVLGIAGRGFGSACSGPTGTGALERSSFALLLLGIAAGMALLLATIGVYGVISYAVSQRTRELGMRMALGAQTGDVKGMILRQGLLLSLLGVTIGLGLSLGLTRVMAGLLFGVSPTDPVTFAAVGTALTAVALTASYLPAHRAAGVDPMRALRSE